MRESGIKRGFLGKMEYRIGILKIILSTYFKNSVI